MSLSNSHKLPEIQKLLKELEEEAHKESNYYYACGIRYCIHKIREIIDSA